MTVPGPEKSIGGASTVGRVKAAKAVLALVRDIAAVTGLALAALYFLYPPSQRVIEESFARSAWFFGGDFRVCSDDRPVSWSAINFHHRAMRPQGEGDCRDPDAVQYSVVNGIETMVGDIVYATRSATTNPPPGRRKPSFDANMVGLAVAFQCYRVRETRITVNSGSKFPNNVWLRLRRTPCL